LWVVGSDLKQGEEVTYNYQLESMKGLFGQQVCKVSRAENPWILWPGLLAAERPRPDVML
jgi:hypothetical protein